MSAMGPAIVSVAKDLGCSSPSSRLFLDPLTGERRLPGLPEGEFEVAMMFAFAMAGSTSADHDRDLRRPPSARPNRGKRAMWVRDGVQGPPWSSTRVDLRDERSLRREQVSPQGSRRPVEPSGPLRPCKGHG